MKTYGRKSRGRQKYDTTLNFDLICRLCLSEDGEMKDLYQEEETSSPPIPLQIMASVSLAVYENDGLPTQVCKKCLDNIEKYYIFKQKCEESDSQLRKVLRHIRTVRGMKDDKDDKDDSEQKPEGEDEDERMEEDSAADGSESATEVKEAPAREVRESPRRRGKTMSTAASPSKPTSSKTLPTKTSTTKNTPTKVAPNMPKKSMDELLVVCEKRSNAMGTAAAVITPTDEGTYVVEVPATDEGDETVDDTMQCSIMIDLPSEATQADRVTETILGYNDFPIRSDHDYQVIDEDGIHYEHVMFEEEEDDDGTTGGYEKPHRVFVVRKQVKREPQDPDEQQEDETAYAYIDGEELQRANAEQMLAQQQARARRAAVDAANLNLLHPFECLHCPKRFVKRIDLRRHLSVHQDKKVLGVLKGYDCEVCDKWFPNSTTLKRHERSHTGERPFACEHCEKRFSQAGILQRHIMTHTGVKPFTCDVCQKGFTQREGLKVHLRTHGPKNPDEICLHECPLCEKSFCHPSGLSRHLLIHTGKTFSCAYCSKAFTDPSSLRRHTRRHEDPK